MKRMPPTAESIEILTAEKESLQDRLQASERMVSHLRKRLTTLAVKLSGVPGLPADVYPLLRD